MRLLPSHKASRILGALYDNAPFEVHVWELVLDAQGEITGWTLLDANARALTSWNRALSDIVGRSADEIFPESNATKVFLPVVRQIFTSGRPYEWEEFFSDTGQLLRMISIPVGDLFISCGMDVSAYRHTEAALRTKSEELVQSLKRLQIATEAAHIGIWEYDLENNSLIWDRSMYQIYGVEPSTPEIPFETWSQGVHPEDVARARRELNEAISAGGMFTSRFRIIRKDTGEVRNISAQAVTDCDDAGNPVRVIGVNLDETERKAAEDRVERLAYFDSLTGLANRSLIEDRLRQAIAGGARTQRHCALLLIDLDRFKKINDSAGHAVGDEVLVRVAQRLQATARDGDTVGRFGGDEFIVILNNLPAMPLFAGRSAEAFAMRLASEIGRPIELAAGSFVSTASIGISLFADDSLDSSEVLRQADLAMYRAKASGRNAVCFFDPVMQDTVLQRLQLENDLQLALANGEFELHYQPQFDDHGTIRGAEALLRWRHPQRGWISPAQFVPVAEESGRIRDIGNWVMATALRDLADHIRAHVDDDFTMAVNVSPVQLHDADFHDGVAHQVASSGVRPDQVVIEITESALLDAGREVADKLAALKALGLRFSLDDFGTGYSSLTMLKQLPIDELKIDRSFVSDIHDCSDSFAIARAVIALAQSMGIGIIAEGVETAQQRDILRRLGCRFFQGYHFGRPIPLEELIELLRRSAAIRCAG